MADPLNPFALAEQLGEVPPSQPAASPREVAPAGMAPAVSDSLEMLSDEELIALDQSMAGPDIDRETQHEQITWKDRLVAKNFANSPEAMVRYLKKEHPELQIESYGGNVIVRDKSKGEQQFKVLDPEGFQLGDIVADIGDIGYDVVAGLGTSAATAGGATLGTALGPVGTVALGSAAGAASSAGLEALRQKIGQGLGIEQDIDTGQIGGAAIGGVVSPLLFGVGGQVGKQALKQGQRMVGKGLFGIGAEAVGKIPKQLASLGLGKPAKAITEGIDELATINKWDADPQAMKKYFKDLADDMQKATVGERRRLGKVVENTASKVEDVDLSSAFKRTFQKMKQELDLADSPEATATAMEAIEQFREIVGTKNLKNVTGYQAFDMKKRLASLANVAKRGDQTLGGRAKVPINTQNFERFANDLGVRINKRLAATARSQGVGYKRALKASEEFYDLVDDAKVNFKDAESMQKTLRMGGRKGKEIAGISLEQLDKKLGSRLKDAGKKLQAWDNFGEAAAERAASGLTLTSRRTPIASALGTFGGFAGYGVGGAVGGGLGGLAGGALGTAITSPAMVKKGMQIAAKMRNIPGYKPSPTEANILWNLIRTREGQVK